MSRIFVKLFLLLEAAEKQKTHKWLRPAQVHQITVVDLFLGRNFYQLLAYLESLQ